MDKIPQQLLDILACPACKNALKVYEKTEDTKGLLCSHCSLLFPVRQGIPVLLLEEAVKL